MCQLSSQFIHLSILYSVTVKKYEFSNLLIWCFLFLDYGNMAEEVALVENPVVCPQNVDLQMQLSCSPLELLVQEDKLSK